MKKKTTAIVPSAKEVRFKQFEKAKTKFERQFQDVMKNESAESKLIANGIMNGFSESILGFFPPGLGFSPTNIGTQVNQTDTLFINNRWYFVSNFRQLLSEAYVEHGLLQTAVDLPVDDGFRGGIEVKTKQLSPEELEKLKTHMDGHDDIPHLKQAVKWVRLFGGGALLILSGQNWEEPLNIHSLSGADFLDYRPVEMWELFFGRQDTEGPVNEVNMETQQNLVEFYSYYGKKIHHSRVLKMKGLESPSFLRPRLRGWGFSIAEIIIEPINQFLKSKNLLFEVLDEFKVDVYKIKGLTNTLLNPNGRQKVQNRIFEANQFKNYQHAITMDSEDDFTQKQLTFAGLSDMSFEIRLGVASALRMPLSKLFGIGAQGFSSGEDDIENYNGMVESQVREKSKREALFITSLRCQQLFGYIPDDLSIAFKPMRILSSEQEENVKTQQYTRVLQGRQAGELTALEYRDACNKGNLLPIQLETDEATLAEVEEEKEAAQGEEEGDSGEKAKKAPKSKLNPKKAKD